MVPRRIVSGAACAAALVRAGFSVEHQNDGVIVLSRGYRAVVVPALAELSAPALTAVLTAAGLCYGDFFALLDGHSSAEIGRTRSGMRPRSEPPVED